MATAIFEEDYSLRLLRGELLGIAHRREQPVDPEEADRLFSMISAINPAHIGERITAAKAQVRFYPQGHVARELARDAMYAYEAWRDHLDRIGLL